MRYKKYLLKLFIRSLSLQNPAIQGPHNPNLLLNNFLAKMKIFVLILYLLKGKNYKDRLIVYTVISNVTGFAASSLKRPFLGGTVLLTCIYKEGSGLI